MAIVQASKAAIRKEIKSKLLQLTKEQKRIQSEFVQRKLFSLSVFENSNRICVYLSTDLEISTEEICEKIFEAGKSCFIPRYSNENMEMVKLLSMEDWKSLPLTKYKIRQPDLKEKRENALETGGLDLIIVPGVAFTEYGERCGHGGGYYDSFFKKLKVVQDPVPCTIGVAFKEQILSTIPTTVDDYKLDMVLYADNEQDSHQGEPGVGGVHPIAEEHS